MAKLPALRTRVNQVKRQLRSGRPAEILLGAKALAAHLPEVADTLLDGVTVHQRDGVSTVQINKVFKGSRSAQPDLDHGLLMAVLYAPEGSNAAQLRAEIHHLSTSAQSAPIAAILDRLPGLRALTVRGSLPSDLHVVVGSELEHLSLTSMYGVTVDLTILAEANLTRLKVSQAQAITGLSALSTLTCLEHLSLWGAHGLDLATLPSGLARLSVESCRDVVGVAALPRGLTELHLSGVHDPALHALAELPLEKLWIRFCPLEGLSPLRGHPTLKYLAVTGSEITNLAGLSGLPALESVSLVRNRMLTSLEGLEDCVQLRYLYIGEGAALADIRALEAVPSLQDLTLRDATALTDLGPALRLPQLQKRGVYRCGAELPDPPSDPLEAIEFPDAWVRSQALDALEAVPGPAALKAISSVLADPAKHLRRHAARVLGVRPDGTAVLAAQVAEGRLDAAWSLFASRNPAGTPALIGLLGSRSAEERAVAAVCLSRVPGGSKALQDALADPAEEVRRWAAYALGQQGSDPQVLAASCRDPVFRVRRAALGALAALGATHLLEVGLEDQDPALVRQTQAWLAPVSTPQPQPGPVWMPRAHVHRDSTSATPKLSGRSDLPQIDGMILAGSYHNTLGDSYVFPPLPSLRHLEVLTRALTRPDPFLPLTSLEALHLGSNKKLTTLEGLEQLTALRSLTVTSTSVSDLTPLQGLPLERLRAGYSRVQDLGPLVGCPLRVLEVPKTRVSDLAAVGDLSSLTVLNLTKTRVTDLTPLGGLAHLRVLHLDHTPVTDFSALARLPSLTELAIWETAFDHAELLLPRRWKQLTLDRYRGMVRSDPIGYRALQEAVHGDGGAIG